jgi:hypothetical protein
VRLLITGDQTPRRVLHRCTTPFFFSRVLMRRRVKLFNPTKCYGFIQPQVGDKDVLPLFETSSNSTVLFLIQTSEASALYRRDVNKDVVALSRANSAAAAPLS